MVPYVQGQPVLRILARFAQSCFGKTLSFATFFASEGLAQVQLEPFLTAGTFQQPTSSYYLAQYGGSINLSFGKKESFILRYQYCERPEFHHSNFVDQDTLYALQIGRALVFTDKHRILSFGGYGTMKGFVKQEETTRSYKMNGISLGVEYGFVLSPMILTLGHQLFAGIPRKEQQESFVTWPFQTFYAGISWRFSLFTSS